MRGQFLTNLKQGVNSIPRVQDKTGKEFEEEKEQDEENMLQGKKQEKYCWKHESKKEEARRRCERKGTTVC